MVIVGLHVVVGPVGVVVVVDGVGWLLGPVICSRQPGMGKRGSKATVSTHPKYTQDLHQIYTKYASVSKEWVYIFGLDYRNARIKGKA